MKAISESQAIQMNQNANIAMHVVMSFFKGSFSGNLQDKAVIHKWLNTRL